MLASWRLLTGDCLDVLATREPDSVDACVTDPPYSLSFMGRSWDTFRSSHEFEAWTQQWAEAVLRVLKPGAHAVVCASPRMGHRVTCGLEDAGFKIRDSLLWLYSQGFPKSLNLSRSIDKQRSDDHRPVCRFLRSAMESQGITSKDLATRFECHPRLIDHWAARDSDSQPTVPTPSQWAALKRALTLDDSMDAEVSRLNSRKGDVSDEYSASPIMHDYRGATPGMPGERFSVRESVVRELVSDTAKQWDGWGTALKPAYEPVILARKPLGGRTVAQCVAAFGTGALNIDGCRLKGGKPWSTNGGQGPKTKGIYGHMRNIPQSMHGLGRWPPNVALDEEAAARLDAEGGTSRFFYVAKASRDERERGCEDLPHKTAGDATDRQDGSAGLNSPRAGASRTHGARNHHPTVKPVALMRWLVRLVTPPGGLVLDPFAGSGTTGLACIKEQCRFLGIEREAEYVAIANARIRAEHVRYETGGPLFTGAVPDTADTCLR